MLKRGLLIIYANYEELEASTYCIRSEINFSLISDVSFAVEPPLAPVFVFE